jgi:hypothetical protein
MYAKNTLSRQLALAKAINILILVYSHKFATAVKT